MVGVLLDTHALYWLVSGVEPIDHDALIAIGESQAAGRLFVSPISAWELSTAARKPAHRNPPDLSSTASAWFDAAVRATSATVVAINRKIAIEAAVVPMATGHKDPGDCFLIATSRVRKVPIVTRDAVLHRLAAGGYLAVIGC